MVTIGLARWTPESATEIGKRSAKLKPLPDFIKVSGPYMYPDVDQGIRAVAIYKYDKSKAGEAAGAIANSFMLYHGIPGFRYSLTLASGAAATMKMMGLG